MFHKEKHIVDIYLILIIITKFILVNNSYVLTFIYLKHFLYLFLFYI